MLSACSHLDHSGVRPGVSTLAEVQRSLGPPAMRWSTPEGIERLAFTTSPMGYQTWMVTIGAHGRVSTIENVLTMPHFAHIQAGLSQEDVLRTLGPPYPGWTIYYRARDELVWEWRYCDAWAEPARFSVLFDGASGRVRSTIAQPERMSMPWGSGNRREWCSP
ncbi:hypothetical protein [Zoogloea sp.]|uniref:hypothetical protein n=1 Tax=Zoogloea sp. TaxID=49181 RepID=UPI0026316554|nr:hypothetical protein [Zoogloea sp.]MDD3353998.1 hypothetical protein [Zoogloea sp.]